LLLQSTQSGLIEKEEVDLISRVFQLTDIPIRQMMIPRKKMIALNIKLSLHDALEIVQRHTHNYFPVYERSLDNIIGFIHVKDIYKAILSLPENSRLPLNLIHKTMSVSESRRADDTLRDMRKRRLHIAIVHDEFDGTAGMITIGDILTHLLVDKTSIKKPLQEIEKMTDGSYIIDGFAPAEKILKMFHISIQGYGYATIGGLVFGLLGREAKIGDSVQIGTSSLEVVSKDGQRIETIRLKNTK
jgi:CBS domain containing-hemolysin-like protein